MLKSFFGDTLKEMLGTELNHELGYAKYDFKNKETDNSRNGYSLKKVKFDYSKINLYK